MASGVWVSSFRKNPTIGLRQGIRWRFQGGDWSMPQHRIELTDLKFLDEIQLNASGHVVSDDCFPEAVAIWNEESFSQVGDLFYVAGFLAVKGALAQIISEFDLQNSRLMPFKILRQDLEGIAVDDCFFLNFGSRKNTFVPEDSKLEESFLSKRKGRRDSWDLGFGVKDGDIVLSGAALEGADFWVEEKVKGGVFLSGDLVAKIRDIDIRVDLILSKCSIEGEL